MIDIFNTTHLNEILKKLDPSIKPLWGKMSPQHAVEHLAGAIKISSGKINVKLYNNAEVAEKTKAYVIYTENEMLQGIKNPTLPEDVLPLIHANMETAIEELFNEINYFKEYYKANPTATHTQPRMGDLNYNEWLTLHNKHFTHHFKQFGVLN